MVSTAALIAALQGQFAAARQGQGIGASAGLPGLLGAGNGEGGNAINALAGGGIAGGGVPTTATTGASIASGGGSPGSLDPLQQQVQLSGAFKGGELGERGDLGAGVAGGDLATLLSVLGGPMAIPAILGSLVGSSVLGLPPTTSINSLLSGSDPANVGSLGILNQDRDSGFGGPFSTGLSPPSSANIGSLGVSFDDRDKAGPPGGNSNQFDTPEFGV